MSATPSKFLLLSLAATAYGSIQNEVACSFGYREDAIIQRYESGGLKNRIDLDSIHSVVIELNYLASFNHNLYLRAMGNFAESLSDLKKQHHRADSEILSARGGRAHSASGLGAVGWQFDFDHGRYTWCLEAGGLYTGIKYFYETSHRLELYAPFVGTLLHFPLNHRWYLECDLDYIFSSSRCERVAGVDFKKGAFQGPRGGLALGVHFDEQISLALDWKTFYFFTEHRTQATIDRERTRWQMQQFSAQFSYRF